ncbi:hypothetical protein CDCA_CDCA02G0483 [Cyanidium caldarium]|uniref:MSP domain-containing protein n=1 Tax=Cyanidium caldarium TaxID=2771 RepID=A0AAV9IR09_CYACA|nr:hypothetical protein CDCA_CDCA02G0483 [Cyanidium caldarium]|eukprot:ctg_701.g363
MENVLTFSETRFAFHVESLEKPTVFVLKVHNVAKETVGFKVKTTRPRRYCVKPNAASLAADETAELQLQLQPLKRLVNDACAALARSVENGGAGEDAERAPGGDGAAAGSSPGSSRERRLSERLTYANLKQELSKELRDKFLIQALSLKGREMDTALFDTADREELLEQKFRCEFYFTQGLLEKALEEYAREVGTGATPPTTTTETTAAGAPPTAEPESEVARLRQALASSEAHVARLNAMVDSGSKRAITTAAAAPDATRWLMTVCLALLLGVLIGKYVLP